MNLQALATRLSVSTKSVSDWVRKGCPHTRTTRGGYVFRLRQVQAWRAANLSSPLSPSNTLSEARRRKETALAELRELDVRVRKGELVERAAVEKRFFAMVRTSRDLLQNIPDRLAGVLAAETDQARIHALLTQEIRQALEALSS